MFICKIYKDGDTFIDACRKDYDKFDALSIIDVASIAVGMIITDEGISYYYSSEWDAGEIAMYAGISPFQIIIYGDKSNYNPQFIENIKHLSGVVWVQEDI